MQNIFKFIALTLIALGLLQSCKKQDETVGMVIQPNENKLALKTISFDNFEIYTASAPAVKTSKIYNYVLLGSLNDSKIGKTSAFFTSQYVLGSQNVNFGTNPELISFKIQLDAVKQQGDSLKTLNIRVNELLDFDINPDSLYPANTDLSAYLGEEVANEIITLDTSDVISFPLNTNLANKILNADSEVLKDDDNFKQDFKGLVFSVDTNSMDLGVIWKISLASAKSYIELKYRSINEEGQYDTVAFKLKFGSVAGRFNSYYINNSNVASYLQSPPNIAYIASPGVARAHINLAPVLALKDSGDLMIYKAELVAKAVKTEETIDMPDKLLLQIDEGEDKDSISYINDIPKAIKNSNFGGAYNEETGAYHLVITRHLQNLLDGSHTDSLLWFRPVGQAISTHRTMLLNGTTDNDKITLNITYSKLH